MTYETVGVSTGTSRATSIASSTTANTKGSWVELDASTAFAVDGFFVYIGRNSGANFDVLVDIGIGVLDSEVVLVPDLLYSTGDTAGEAIFIPIPMSIASGTRISARCQDRVASATTIDVAIILTTDSGLDITAFTGCDAMGQATGDSGGTQIDPGTSANTKTAYVELVASTSNTYKAFIIIMGQIQNQATATGHWLFDVAIGADTAEVDFLSNLNFSNGNGPDSFQPKVFGPMACDIPSGSRLTVRGQSSITNANDRRFDVVLYGLF